MLTALVACDNCECASVDYAVSSPPNDASGTHRRWPQSETSMVRVDLPPGRNPRDPVSRFVVGYNDSTQSTIADGSCWRFNERASQDGWAFSDGFGADWQRQTQLPVTDGLRKLGVNARHGDPWLAAWSSPTEGVNSLVLYVSVGQAGLPRDQGPFFVLLTRSFDNGRTFAESTILHGPTGGVPDGPKIAITGDGVAALAAWNPGGRFEYRLAYNLLEPSVGVNSPQTLDPLTVATPPGTACTLFGVGRHPRVAAGRATYYLAGEFLYHCGTSFFSRLEVHRNTHLGIAIRVPWERILSAEIPGVAGLPDRGRLNTMDTTKPMPFGTLLDRGDILPALAVGQGIGGEFVVVVTEEVQLGTAADEASRERIVQYRIPGANHCNALDHRGDLESCGLPVVKQELESISVAGDMRSVASRVGLWASKPAAFSGRVPDGTIDERVGIAWYAQPYKGRLSASAQDKTKTIVEAAVSTNGGISYEGPFNLTAASERDGIFTDDDAIGPYFFPCPIVIPTGSSFCFTRGYFGEYISGAFQFTAPKATAIVAAWGDSREGCVDQGVEAHHQHVWAGAVRGRLK